MITVTHNGTINNIAYILPICSWINKTTNDKILFLFSKHTKDIDKIITLLKIQKFTEDVILIDENNIIEPLDYGFKYDKHYGFKSLINDNNVAYQTNVQASSNNLGVDSDFILNIGTDFNYDKTNIVITPGLSEIFPYYTSINDDMDILSSLRLLAAAKERHVNFNDFTIYMSLSAIPFYLYLFDKKHGFYTTKTKDNFWLELTQAPVLDVRDFNEKNKIVSVYNKIYFNNI